MVGRAISHYEITEKLGEGGMGVVYKARDARLGRTVAIKVVNAEFTQRFEREAKAIAALNHPHICTLHDVGEHEGAPYLVMEYVEGKPLKGPLPASEALRYAIQVCEALAAAHKAGIVHRDLKPDNILLTTEGSVKVLDFGLAKLQPRVTEGTLTATMTEQGVVTGTAPYMSPEQARGEPVDARSDIFSFGVVLYELLSGRRAFRRDTMGATLAAVITTELPRLHEAPSEVAQLVGKMLIKKRENRYQSAQELLNDLRAVAQPGAWVVSRRRSLALAGGLPVALAAAAYVALNLDRLKTVFSGRSSSVRSLAVLPLENLSGDAEQEYLADGIQEALITDLSRLRGLRQVTNRYSVMRYRKTSKPLPEIGRELGVDAIVTGSVLRASNRVRVTAHLVKASNEEPLWNEGYEREYRDVLALQNEIVAAISQAISLQLSPQEQTRLAKARPVDPEAHEAYVKGVFYLNKRTQAGFAKGLELLQQAIEKHPEEPLLYSGLALGIAVTAHGLSLLTPAVDFPRALAAAHKAVELDEDSPQAHTALAAVKVYYEYDWDGAEREFQRALELDPSLADAHLHHCALLFLFGRAEEAIAEARKAKELDPLAPLVTSGVGWLYWLLFHEPDRAIEEERKTLEIDPNSPDALYVLGGAYADKKMFDQAFATRRKLAEINPDWRYGLAELYAEVGRKDEALRALADMERENYPKHALFIAGVQTMLGNKEETFRALQAAYQYRHIFLPWTINDDDFPWQSDPRFQELRRRLNLPV